MIIFACIFISLFFLQFFSFGSEKERTFSDASENSGITDTASLFSSIDSLEPPIYIHTETPQKLIQEKVDFPFIFLSGLKNRRWEYARSQLFQTLYIHTEYPPYELLLKIGDAQYYEPAVDEAYRLGWILDVDEETWEQEQQKEKEFAHPDLAFILSSIEESVEIEPKAQETLEKRKFQAWREKRDEENVKIIMILNCFLWRKTFSKNETKGFIESMIKSHTFPQTRQDVLELYTDTDQITRILDRSWMFVVDEDDEESYSSYTQDLLVQEIQNRFFEEDIDIDVNNALMKLKQDQYLPSTVFMRQQRRMERLKSIKENSKTLVIHEPDNQEAICPFMWNSSSSDLSTLLAIKSTPLTRKKERSGARVSFDDITARIDYHKKDPVHSMDFQGFFVLSPKERTLVPKTRTRAIASTDINDAWKASRQTSIKADTTRTPFLRRNSSMSFESLVTCPKSFEAYGNDSDV